MSFETVRDSYALQRMDECVHSLDDAAVSTKPDCGNWYWEIMVAETDRNEMIFTFQFGLFRFFRTAFRLDNASATFQRAVDIPFSSVRKQNTLMYLEDVTNYLKSVMGH